MRTFYARLTLIVGLLSGLVSARAQSLYVHKELFQQGPSASGTRTAGGLNNRGEVLYIYSSTNVTDGSAIPSLWLPKSNYGLPAGFTRLTNFQALARSAFPWFSDDGTFYTLVTNASLETAVYRGTAAGESQLCSQSTFVPLSVLTLPGDPVDQYLGRRRFVVDGVTAQGQPFGHAYVQRNLNGVTGWGLSLFPEDMPQNGLFVGQPPTASVTTIPTLCGPGGIPSTITSSPNGTMLIFNDWCCPEWENAKSPYEQLAVAHLDSAWVISSTERHLGTEYPDPESTFRNYPSQTAVNNSGDTAGANGAVGSLWRALHSDSVVHAGRTNVSSVLLDTAGNAWFVSNFYQDIWRWDVTSPAATNRLHLPWITWGYTGVPTLAFVNDRGELLVHAQKTNNQNYAVLLSPRITVVLTVSTNQLSVGDSLTVTGTVTALGDQPLTGISPTGPLDWIGKGAFKLLSGPTPAPPWSLQPGEQMQARWQCQATTNGVGRFGLTLQAPPLLSLLANSEPVSIALHGDLLIKREVETNYAGRDFFQTVARSPQVKTNTIALNQDSKFQIQIRNGNKLPQTFTLKAAESSPTNWLMSYLLGAQDMRAQLSSPNAATLPELNPDTSLTLQVVVRPTNGMAGAMQRVVFTLGSASDATLTLDAVEAVSRLGAQLALAITPDHLDPWVGETLSVLATVTNLTGVDLTNVSPGVLNARGSLVKPGGFQYLDGPIPSNAARLPAGAAATFRYHFRATNTGVVLLAGQAKGIAQGGVPFASDSVQSDWIEIGTIKILDINPVQSVYDVPMIADKPTLARLTIFNSFTNAHPAALKLTTTLQGRVDYDLSGSLNLAPGTSKVLWPKSSSNALDSYFKLQADSQVEVTANPELDLDYAGKKLSRGVPVEVVRPLKIRFLRTKFNTICGVKIPAENEALLPSADQVRDYAFKAAAFIQALFPTPRLVYSISPEPKNFSSYLPTLLCANQIAVVEARLSRLARLSGVDVVCGMLPYRLSEMPRNPGNFEILDFYQVAGTGSTDAETDTFGYCTGPGVLLKMVQSLLGSKPNQPINSGPGILAHEIGHVFGLAMPIYRQGLFSLEEYNNNVKPAVFGREASDGVWIDPQRVWLTETNRQEISVRVDDNGFPTRFNFMSSSDKCNINDLIWINFLDYEWLLQRWKKLQGDPEVTLISGMLGATGLEADSWYSFFTDEVDPAQPDSPFHIVWLDGAGQVMQDHGFAMSYGHRSAPDSPVIGTFVVSAPAVPAARGIEIRQGSQTLLRREVSAHAPEVSWLSLGAASPFIPGATNQLAWSASDADADPITYALLFSEDDGTTWNPLMIDLTTTNWAFTVPDVVTDYGRLQVIATDGIRSTKAISARFAISGTTASGLHARVAAPQSAWVGQTVSLDGSMSRGGLGTALNYRWRLAGMPGASLASLSNATGSESTIILDQPGRYLVELSVQDGGGQSDVTYASVLGRLPELKIETASSEVRLTWVAAASGFVLESSDGLGPQDAWQTVSKPPTVVQEKNIVSQLPSARTQFYRLRKP